MQKSNWILVKAINVTGYMCVKQSEDASFFKDIYFKISKAQKCL